MRSFYIFAWALLTALVMWYIIVGSGLQSSHTAKEDTTQETIVIDEVKGSSYLPSEGNESEGDTIQGNSNEDTSQSEDFQKAGKQKFDYLQKANIEFSAFKTKLPTNPGLESYLDSIAQVVIEKNLTVELIGHTSLSMGNDKQDYEIGLKRANHIRDLLVDRGVDTSFIVTDSKGDVEPRMEGDTKEANTRNRRVELFLKQN